MKFALDLIEKCKDGGIQSKAVYIKNSYQRVDYWPYKPISSYAEF